MTKNSSIITALRERVKELEAMLHEAAGYADEVTDSEGAACFAEECRALLAKPADEGATLVLHYKGPVEKLYTESEVKAIMGEITHSTGSPLALIHVNEIREIFAQHGIVLDPA